MRLIVEVCEIDRLQHQTQKELLERTNSNYEIAISHELRTIQEDCQNRRRIRQLESESVEAKEAS